MAVGADKLEQASALLFEALQELAREIREGMDRIDAAGGVPTDQQIAGIREQIVEFQSLMVVLENALSRTLEGGTFVREIVGGISRKLLSRALTYETAHAARLKSKKSVPLFGAVMFERDLRQLDRLAEQVTGRSEDVEAQVSAARGTLQNLIKRCPEIADFG